MKCSIIATSDYCWDEKENLIKNSKKMGFSNIEFLVSKRKYLGKWAGSPKERLEFLNRAINSDSKAIVAAKGGSGIMHFIREVDFSLIAQNKKLMIGYSNLTPLVNLINQKSGVIALYGPTAFKELDNLSLDILKKAFSMEDYSIPFDSINVLNSPKRNIEGKTVGGNMRTLVKSITMNLGIDLRDKILFIEDKIIENNGEINDSQMYNYLFFLKSYSLFKPKAIVFGGLGIESSNRLKEMVLDLFPKTPLVLGLPFGHKLPNMTIPIGVECKIDFYLEKINFHFPESEKYYSVKL